MAEADPWADFRAAPAGAPAAGDPWADFRQATEAAHAPTAGIAEDVAKQIPAGLVMGVEGVPTAIPRLLNAAGSYLGPKIEKVVGMVSPAKAAEMHELENQRQAFTAANPPPTFADHLPEPQTTAGKFARSAAEFVPGMVAAPGGVVRNAAVGAGSGLASEGAGELTEGTAAEPYARIGAALAGGAAGAKALAPAVAELTPAQVIKAGAEAYKSPEVAAVQIKPQVVDGVSNMILSDLNRSRLNARLAPTTHAIIDDLRNPVNGPTHTIEDFQTARQLLERQAGNYANPTEQAAASKAIGSLDTILRTLPQSELVAGDIGKATSTLEKGRADYAAGKAAERVQGKLDSAELQAASAHSGGNIDNATRQKLRTLLTSSKASRGLTSDEFDLIDQVVRGSVPGNVLRAVGKVMGGGGGLGSLISALEGMKLLGPLGAVAPGVGYAVKKVGDAVTAHGANQAVQQILSRAPSAATLQPAAPAALSPTVGGLAGALMAAPGALPPLSSLPLRLPQQIGQPTSP